MVKTTKKKTRKTRKATTKPRRTTKAVKQHKVFILVSPKQTKAISVSALTYRSAAKKFYRKLKGEGRTMTIEIAKVSEKSGMKTPRKYKISRRKLPKPKKLAGSLIEYETVVTAIKKGE